MNNQKASDDFENTVNEEAKSSYEKPTLIKLSTNQTQSGTETSGGEGSYNPQTS